MVSTETTYSRDILLPNIMPSVLILFHFFFFNFIEFCCFYSTKSKWFFYFYITWNLLYIIWKIWGMLISNFWLVKNTCSIIFCEKVIWLIRKVEHCATFWKSYMINHNAQKLSDFLKIHCMICHIWLIM